MPKIVPIKNVDPVLVDVKDPAVDYGGFTRFASLNLSRVPLSPAVSASRRPFFTVAVLLLMIFSAYFLSVLFNLNNAKEVFAKKGHLVINNFSSALAAIKNFSPREATLSLNENKRALEDLNKMLKRGSGDALFQVAGTVIPVFKEAGGLLGQVTDFNLSFLAISEKLGDLQANGFKYFQSDGTSLTKNLSGIHDLVGKTLSRVESVRNTTANLKDASPLFANFNETISDEYIKYSGELQIWDKALISLLKIIGSPEDAHIALLFQNPAEIRPGGGFIGSYADLVINSGQMKNIDVQDIYWPDHPLNFELKVVPPRPLRTLTKDWGARDGNWFFDFPTSAKTVLGFLEASKLYAEPGVKFEGAIGVNIKVLETILGLTGPISIPEYGMTIDKNNFLIELQREVEAGADKKKGENPKKILKVLTPLIFEKLNNLSPEETVELFEKIKEHIEKKDIMIFAREANLANVLASTDVNGAVYSLPNDFWGSYLAIVNANVAGGKSDAFVNQAIEGRIDVDTDGGIFTDLSIVREHNGNKEKDPWWRAENKNFIQIFGNPGSSLRSEERRVGK